MSLNSHLIAKIGAICRQRRRELRITQKVVYTSIDSDHRTYSQFENGKSNPTMGYIIKVADYLDIKIDLSPKQNNSIE